MMLGLYSVVRQNTICFTPEHPKYFDSNSVLMTAPIFNYVKHSFQPNCVIDGCHLSMENQSFIRLRTTKPIEAEEVHCLKIYRLSRLIMEI